MVKENVVSFFSFVEKDQVVREKQAERVSSDQIVALARENGFEFSSVELEEYMAEIKAAAAQLSDDELDEAVGGCCEDKPGWKYRAACHNPFCGWTGPWSCNSSQQYLADSHNNKYYPKHNAAVEMKYF